MVMLPCIGCIPVKREKHTGNEQQVMQSELEEAGLDGKQAQNQKRLSQSERKIMNKGLPQKEEKQDSPKPRPQQDGPKPKKIPK